MRLLRLCALAAFAVSSVGLAPDPDACRARATDAGTIHWIPAPADAAAEIDRWCRAVGPPLLAPDPAGGPNEPPPLEDLVVVTWNAHMADGRLPDLVRALRSGEL